MSAALRILIVEDEPLIAMDMEMMLQDAGHQVVGEATTVFEVKRLLSGPQPDLACVDMQLADGSSGIDACRAILGQWPDTVVVFITANPSMIPEDFAGGHGVIPKPFSQGGFLAAIEYLCQGITDPPPDMDVPSSLQATPAFARKWQDT